MDQIKIGVGHTIDANGPLRTLITVIIAAVQLHQTGRMRIGEKGREQHVKDFAKALCALQQMPGPAWRRPPRGGRGGWSIVRGTDWARMSQEELDAHVRSEKELSKHIEENHEDD